LAPTLQWAANALRSVGPFVQKILPLLDGNIAAAVSDGLAQQHHQPSPPVNLEPLEDSLAELQTQHRDLRNQIVDQNTSLKRVEDQLEMVREATDRNTLEQQ
jgi:septal ring factor EnvC (AmiA/AmiB activator)